MVQLRREKFSVLCDVRKAVGLRKHSQTAIQDYIALGERTVIYLRTSSEAYAMKCLHMHVN